MPSTVGAKRQTGCGNLESSIIAALRLQYQKRGARWYCAINRWREATNWLWQFGIKYNSRSAAIIPKARSALVLCINRWREAANWLWQFRIKYNSCSAAIIPNLPCAVKCSVAFGFLTILKYARYSIVSILAHRNGGYAGKHLQKGRGYVPWAALRFFSIFRLTKKKQMKSKRAARPQVTG